MPYKPSSFDLALVAHVSLQAYNCLAVYTVRARELGTFGLPDVMRLKTPISPCQHGMWLGLMGI